MDGGFYVAPRIAFGVLSKCLVGALGHRDGKATVRQMPVRCGVAFVVVNQNMKEDSDRTKLGLTKACPPDEKMREITKTSSDSPPSPFARSAETNFCAEGVENSPSQIRKISATNFLI